MDIKKLAKLILELSNDHSPFGIEIAPGTLVHYNMYGYPFWHIKNVSPESSLKEIVKEVFPPHAQWQYWAQYNLWNGYVPQRWISVISQAVQLRKQSGMRDHLDVLHTCKLAAENDLPCRQIVKALGFWDTQEEKPFVDESAHSSIRGFIKIFLEDTSLSEKFLDYATVEAHTGSPIDYYHIPYILETQGMKDASILDFGCGDGDKILSIADELPGNIWAFDMQNLPETFTNWKEPSKVNFQTIAPDAIPLPDCELGVVISVSTLGHWEQGKLETLLKEIYRILKPGGILYVAPLENLNAYYYNDPSLLYSGFQKDPNGEFTQVWP